MIYDDGVKTNEYLRVLECPCCGNNQIGDEDRHCIICRTSLYNECEGEDIVDDWGNYQGKGEQHRNPSNARFCAICGAKTLFFEKGFLKPYTEVKDNLLSGKVKKFNPINNIDSNVDTSFPSIDDIEIPF